MLHHILVKLKEPPADREAFRREVEGVFEGSLSIPGVHSLKVLSNVIDRSNRYDLMIVIAMDREALPLYDASEAHLRWKADYGHLIEKKAIFDCD